VSMSSVVQLLGVLLVVVGLTVVVGPWALVASGVVLVVAPEVGVLVAGLAARGRGDREGERP